ncbi:MAG: hypothetical protein FWE05_13130, partial [Defluviitaleaceae bacterium]|nr:hypothetical protein [Defluviitaleaceae bacterium]
VQYGKLILWLSYDQSQYCKEEMDLLSRVYYAKLIDIITHCCVIERKLICPYHEIESYSKYMNNNVLHKYLSTTAQKFFLSGESSLVAKQKISILGDYSKDEILRALRDIIKNTDPFRMSYYMQEDNFIINEHDYKDDWHIPYFNIINMSSRYKDDLNKRIEENSTWRCLSNSANQLSLIVVTKEEENKHVVHIAVSHAAWDRLSSVIFEEYLIKLLNPMRTFELKLQFSYKDYVKETGLVLDYSFDFTKFMSVADSYLKHNRSSRIIGEQGCILRLGTQSFDFYQKSPWDFIEILLIKWIELNHLVSKDISEIPLFIIQEDRRYKKKDYTDNLGVFLDTLPVTISTGRHNTLPLQLEVEKLQNIKKLNNLNYLSEISNINPVLASSLVRVNYQGIFTLDFDEIERLQQEVNKMDNMFPSPVSEIYINSYSNYMFFFYPVHEQCSTNIKLIMQEVCDQFEGDLS